MNFQEIVKEKGIGTYYINKISKYYCKILEITNYNDDERNIACIIIAGPCKFIGDTNTTVTRYVLNFGQFEENWETLEEKKECEFCKGTGYVKGNQCVDLDLQNIAQKKKLCVTTENCKWIDKNLFNNKKTLSDLRHTQINGRVTYAHYEERYVKEHIKEFIDWENSQTFFFNGDRKNKAKEIFGEDLI